MRVTTPAIVDGWLAEKYGCKGTDFVEGDMPSLSFPLRIEDAPAGTRCFALIFDDPDSVPVCGFAWVHWLAFGFTSPEIPENASQTLKDVVQGYNDWYRHGIGTKERASFYGGPYPPDRKHQYVMTVFALDSVPGLSTGYSKDDLRNAMNGHILAEAEIRGWYSPKA